jgi:hypothetical protein
MEHDKLNDSTGSEFLDHEEKSIFQKIREKPNFIKSLTLSADLPDHKKLKNVENSNLRKSSKFHENAITIKGSSLNFTRNGKIFMKYFSESTEIHSNRLNFHPFSRSTSDYIKKDDLKERGNVKLSLEKVIFKIYFSIIHYV